MKDSLPAGRAGLSSLILRQLENQRCFSKKEQGGDVDFFITDFIFLSIPLELFVFKAMLKFSEGSLKNNYAFYLHFLLLLAINIKQISNFKKKP